MFQQLFFELSFDAEESQVTDGTIHIGTGKCSSRTFSPNQLQNTTFLMALNRRGQVCDVAACQTALVCWFSDRLTIHHFLLQQCLSTCWVTDCHSFTIFECCSISIISFITISNKQLFLWKYNRPQFLIMPCS